MLKKVKFWRNERNEPCHCTKWRYEVATRGRIVGFIDEAEMNPKARFSVLVKVRL